MTINALPTPPSRQDPATFADRGDAFLGALPQFVTETNATAAAVNAAATAAAGSATAAAGSATAAAGSASAAGQSAAAAAASAASAVSAPGTSGTSGTLLTIQAGVANLTTQAGKTFPVGASVMVAKTSDPTRYVVGLVASYDTGSGALSLVGVTPGPVGVGETAASWTVSISGPKGADAPFPPFIQLAMGLI